MGLTPGYKQTDMGVIPEQWVVEPIIDCCDYADYRGKTPPKSQSGTFLVTAKNVRKGFIDYEESQEFVPTELYEQIMRRGKPRIGDILITTEAPLGNVAQVDREDVALAQRIIKYRPKSSSLSADYLKHYLLSDRFQRILVDHSSGSTAKGIKGRVLHQLPLIIPPLPEQCAIAGTLGDVDALIGALNQLITKKGDLKQAAMQQLLTGQKRLPGFQGEWKLKPLETICSLINGRAYNLSEWKTSGTPVIRLQNLTGGEGYYYSNLLLPARQYCDYGDLLYMWSATFGPHIWKGGKAIFHYHIWKVEPRIEDADKGFLYQKLHEITQGLKQRATNGGTMLHLTKASMEKLPVMIPPTKGEQIAIAEVLSDMDAEIEALEQRLAKTHAIKQGMMQELLTGRTRLK
jgi:type I restriction enzyme S subunit